MQRMRLQDLVARGIQPQLHAHLEIHAAIAEA